MANSPVSYSIGKECDRMSTFRYLLSINQNRAGRDFGDLLVQPPAGRDPIPPPIGHTSPIGGGLEEKVL